jgi:hypothetical protein
LGYLSRKGQEERLLLGAPACHSTPVDLDELINYVIRCGGHPDLPF